MHSKSIDSTLLRRSLQINAVFSGVSGIAAALAAQPISNFIGTHSAGTAHIFNLGITLLIFAAFLIYTAARQIINERFALTAIIMDYGWVIGSVAILMMDVFSLSLAGKILVGIIALLVLDFAILQTLGLQRMRKSTAPAS
jgi:hypothetical protein